MKLNSFLFNIFFICFIACGFAQSETKEQEVKINPLINGTLLTTSTDTTTLAIIIPGSGPTDRNGNQRMMQNNSLKLLAEGLTKNGISTFRYDKRIFALVAQNNLKEEELDFKDFVDDAVDVAKYFKDKGYKKIILVGHSQGALIAMLAAKETDVAKVVSLNGAAESVDKLIIKQLEQQAPALKEDAERAFEDLKTTGKAEKFSPGLFSLLRPSVQPFMRSWMLYDPTEIIKSLEIPVLIITGSKDLQVPPADGEILSAAKPDAKYVNIENMNHILKEVKADDDIENSKTYSESYLPVMPEAITVISEFIKE